MKAIEVQKHGGPEVLTHVDVAVPSLKPTEVLVKIAAIGVNYIDIYFRDGRYPAKTPFIDGQEAAGTVVALGSSATRWREGDRVAYTGVLGSYAEFAAVSADRLVHIPDSISDQDAAAAMLQGMTAHYLVNSTYPLRSGETVLVHAAAGGVGRLLVQMASNRGARVIATAGTESKAELARLAGASDVIVYTQQDFEEEVKRLTGGRGIDVIYDGVGKTTFDKDLNLLRPRGLLVLFGAASGSVPPFDPIVLSQKGSLFLTRPMLGHYIATREELEHRAADVFAAIIENTLSLHIEHAYPLAQAAESHRAMESRRTSGKVLLLP